MNWDLEEVCLDQVQTGGTNQKLPSSRVFHWWREGPGEKTKAKIKA